MAVELATAYVSLVPTMRGMKEAIRREIDGSVSEPLKREAAKAGPGTGKMTGSKFVDGFNDSLKKLGLVAAGAAAGNFLQGFVRDSVQASASLQAATATAGQVFGDTAVLIEQFADTASETLGQSARQATEAATSFATFGKSAGLTGTDLVDFSTELTSLASDLAAFKDTTPEDALVALQAALRGESEPIRRYGVLLDDLTLRQQALSLGLIQTTTQALTPQQRVLAAQALIMKQTGDAQGQFARESGQLGTESARLSAKFEDMQAEIGERLLPAVIEGTKALQYLVDVIPDWASSLGTLADVFGKIGGAAEGATGPINGLREAFFKMNGTALDTVPLLGDIMRTLTPVLNAYNEAQGKAEDAARAQAAAASDSATSTGDAAQEIAAAGDAALGSAFSFDTFADAAKGLITAAADAGRTITTDVLSVMRDMAEMRFEATLYGLDGVAAATARLAHARELLAAVPVNDPVARVEAERNVLEQEIALDQARADAAAEALANRQAERQAASREAAAAREAAVREARAAAEAIRQQAASLRDAVAAEALGNITQVPASAKAIAAGLRARVEQIKAFGRNIATLASRGLPGYFLRQIVDAGVTDGAAIAATLASASDLDFRKVVKQAGRAEAAASALGIQSSGTFYGGATAAAAPAAPVVHVYIGDEEVTSRIDVRIGEHDRRQRQRARAGSRY